LRLYRSNFDLNLSTEKAPSLNHSHSFVHHCTVQQSPLSQLGRRFFDTLGSDKLLAVKCLPLSRLVDAVWLLCRVEELFPPKYYSPRKLDVRDGRLILNALSQPSPPIDTFFWHHSQPPYHAFDRPYRNLPECIEYLTSIEITRREKTGVKEEIGI
jgi:hypothetical protein